PEPNVPERFDGFLAYCSAMIGDQVFSAVAHRPLGIDEMHNGRRRVMFGPSRTLWSRMSRRDVWSEEPMLSVYQRQLDRLGERAEIMAIGNLAKMVQSGSEDAPLSSDLPSGRERDLQKSSRGKSLPGSRRNRPPRTTAGGTK